VPSPSLSRGGARGRRRGYQRLPGFEAKEEAQRLTAEAVRDAIAAEAEALEDIKAQAEEIY